ERSPDLPKASRVASLGVHGVHSPLGGLNGLCDGVDLMDHERAGGMSPSDQIARIAECQGNHSGTSVQCRREGFFLEVGDDKVDREWTSCAFADQGDLLTQFGWRWEGGAE